VSGLDPASAPRPLPARYLPRIAPLEWLVFVAIAGLLALANIYSILVTGWGFGGSIVAVVLASSILQTVRGKRPATALVNLGQTMGSASGYMAAIVASFVAVRMVDPTFTADPVPLVGFFAAAGIAGALIGAAVRRHAVHYSFPSGTACAVLQQTVEAAATRDGAVRLRTFGRFGALAALMTIPAKLSTTPHGPALLSSLPLGGGVSLAVDPLPLGIGILVGPRIGVGMLLGSLATPWLIAPLLGRHGIDAAEVADWTRWTAIALMALPTFAAAVFTYALALRRGPAVAVEAAPARARHAAPPSRGALFAVLGVAALVAIGGLGRALFGLPIPVTGLIVCAAVPLCLVMVRVTGETDITPLPIMTFLLLATAAATGLGDNAGLVAVSLLGATLATLAVDMCQDYRTGHLLDASPVHQTSVQLVGAVLGAAVAVPVILALDAHVGLGVGTAFPAPTAQMVAAMAGTFGDAVELGDGLRTTIAAVSVAGCAYAFFAVWPRTARFVPSLFGIGIGLLLPGSVAMAIFAGSLLQIVARRSSAGEPAGSAGVDRALLIGAAVLAAAALTSIAVVVLAEGLGALGLRWFFVAAT
jgi:uncharacterized oligopeptide transporter (OPT) family protein